MITWRRFALFLTLSVIAHAPCFDNGFIADDYVVLERSQEIFSEPLLLFASPPEGFRTTSYLAFAVLKLLFGYKAGLFYSFSIVLRAISALLLGRLVSSLTGRDDVSLVSAALFTVLQNSCESVMWLSAINEALLGVFVLACLISWTRKRYLLALVWYFLAWFSKESALMVLPLVALIDSLGPAPRPQFRKYVLLLAPSVIFLAVLLAGWSRNPLITHGFYSFGWRFLLVEINSFHRLLFPAVYGLVIWVALSRSSVFPVRPAGLTALLILTALAPYSFLTYQNHIPSRQLHVASMGLAVLSAYLVCALARRLKIAGALVSALILMNVGYIWIVKDAQFEQRARPTNQLVLILRSETPRRIVIERFAANPWIAKLTARLATGWTPEDLLIPGLDPPCPECETWEWDSSHGDYVRQR